MTRVLATATLALLCGVNAPALAATLTQQELMQAATALAQRYDTTYGSKDPDAMSKVYAEDGVLISPAGPIVRGRDELKAYYTKRFAAGARGHKINVLEVHVIGDAGYGINQFSVSVPQANGAPNREEHGTIVTIYRHEADGWHMALVAPSVPETAGKK